MTLTLESVAQLNARFEFTQHEFTRGFVYIREDAVCHRLDEVDPGWSFKILDQQVRGSKVTVAASLTVCGVTRDGVGMQDIFTNKDGKETGEPEKGAATDALKRCARLFGIGRYLLNAPPENQFQKWLEGNAPSPSGNGSKHTDPGTGEVTREPVDGAEQKTQLSRVENGRDKKKRPMHVLKTVKGNKIYHFDREVFRAAGWPVDDSREYLFGEEGDTVTFNPEVTAYIVKDGDFWKLSRIDPSWAEVGDFILSSVDNEPF